MTASADATNAVLQVLAGASSASRSLLLHNFQSFLTLGDTPSALTATSPEGANLYVVTSGPEATAAFQAAVGVPHRLYEVDAQGLFRHLLEKHTGYDGVVVDPEGPHGPFFLSFRQLYGFFLGFGMVRDRLTVLDGRHAAVALQQNAPGNWDMRREGEVWVARSGTHEVTVTVDPQAKKVDIDPVAAADLGRACLQELKQGGDGRLAMKALVALDAAVSAIGVTQQRVSRASMSSPASAYHLRTKPAEYSLKALNPLLELARSIAKPS